MGYIETRTIPFGELADLIAVEQIKNGEMDWKPVKSREEEEKEFWRLTSFQ